MFLLFLSTLYPKAWNAGKVLLPQMHRPKKDPIKHGLSTDKRRADSSGAC